MSDYTHVVLRCIYGNEVRNNISITEANFCNFKFFMFDHSDINTKATELCAAYPSDLDISLGNELIHFRSFMQDKQSPTKILQTLLDLDLQSAFPNVYVATRIFLTLPITNCDGERSFSHLARIKNELSTRMSQKRLCSLSLMAIVSELVK